MKKENRFDRLFENLKSNLSGIMNFHLLLEDEKGQQIYKFITNRIAELQGFKTLMVNYYLPAASKSIVDDRRELEQSKYKHLIKMSKEDFKENYYETVRLGYVGMFHKFENFIRDLIISADLLFNADEEEITSIENFAKTEFNYEIRKWQNYVTINRLNWICNCIKHYDALPIKSHKPKIYESLPIQEKIKFNKEDFVRDIEMLASNYQIIMQTVFFIGSYKMLANEMDYLSETESNLKLE
ncbi:MAG: hypothetical protein IPM77_12820 [Crocinitomicaceae bacterium]|nr:hypothetical protein [Crocinitomicaceae bacterium]